MSINLHCAGCRGESDFHSCGRTPRDKPMYLKGGNTLNSASDERTVNNVMRHEYRVLSEEEKQQMQSIKDIGLSFHEYMDSIGSSREISLAKTKIEEAVMWAIKHITR